MSNSIWTLEARDSVMLEVVASHFDLPNDVMRKEIWDARGVTVAALEAKGVSYGSLRNALVPQRDRFEVGLLFDTIQIESGSYGFEVAERLVPLLPRGLTCATRSGDLIIDDQELGFELLQRHVIAHRPSGIAHTTQLYCVYVNNLSRPMMDRITLKLQEYGPFVGYVDASTSSRMKDWLSLTLVTGYLKAGEIVLNGHEDDVPDTEDWNLQGWPWEKDGYTVRSIRDMYFHLFLGYKIERRVVPGLESDTAFALTAISGRPLALKELPVEVDDAKGEYLRREHGSSLERAGLDQISSVDLAALVKGSISENYIYNLRYLEEHETSLFNIILEVRNPESRSVTKLLAGIEYQPETPRLKLVTLY